MNYDDFLTRVIEDGIESAKRDPDLIAHPKRLEGAIEGFEACRGKTIHELHGLHNKSENACFRAQNNADANLEDYWKLRYYSLQVEWVCNCVSAIMHAQGLPPIIPPTAQAYIKAAEIVGVAEER